MITKVKKRDARIVDFDQTKVKSAIWKAVQAVGGKDEERANYLTAKVIDELEKEYDGKRIPSVEDIQNTVEKVLIEEGHSATAKAFILYRKKRQELRDAKLALGIEDDMKLSFDALKILTQYKILQRKDAKLETPREMFIRVAKALAQAEKRYNQLPSEAAETFTNALTSLDLLPSISILRTAGTEKHHFSEGYVLPVQDDIASLFDTLKLAALLHKHQQRGFGVGLSFSPLRPKGTKVAQSITAGGPVTFLRLYDRALHQINPNGANLAFLSIHHPDIIDFITSRESQHLRCFGVSVLLTKEFMKAVEEDKQYDLINPHNSQTITKLRARSVLDMIATIAWRTGDPAVVFLDNMNKYPANPFEAEQIEATTPSGDHPLLPFESCFTASINLKNHVASSDSEFFNWEKLKQTTATAVHMLDNAIDECDFPNSEMKKAIERTRRIGIGVMGWADALIKLEIPYNSEEAVKLAEKVMKFINNEAREASIELSKKRGTFEAYKDSRHSEKSEKIRNITRTSINPSGALSVIASCSQGIEPYFAVSYLKRTPITETFEIIPIFEETAHREGFYSAELMKSITLAGSVQDNKEVPEKWRKIFITAHDCSIQEHLAMQVAFQKHTDNAVSKTINLQSTATIHEVEEIYKKAYELGCKSVHVYREGSSEQLLHSNQNGLKRKRKKVRMEV